MGRLKAKGTVDKEALAEKIAKEFKEEMGALIWQIERSKVPVVFPVLGMNIITTQVKDANGNAMWRKLSHAPDAQFHVGGIRTGARSVLVGGRIDPSPDNEIVHELPFKQATEILSGFQAWVDQARSEFAVMSIEVAEAQANRYVNNDQFGSW